MIVVMIVIAVTVTLIAATTAVSAPTDVAVAIVMVCVPEHPDGFMMTAPATRTLEETPCMHLMTPGTMEMMMVRTMRMLIPTHNRTNGGDH